MIVKYFEINKIKDLNNKLILLYGKNEGLKTQAIQQILSKELVLLLIGLKIIINTKTSL